MKKLLSLLVTMLAVSSAAAQDDASLLKAIMITGGTVVDGSGTLPYEANVVVHDGRIVGIGDRSREGKVFEIGSMNIDARWQIEELDATGMIITPGFIDTHAHGDPLETPDFENFLAMGVTTICTGQDGNSTPAREMRDWLAQIDEIKPGPNLAPFIGHGTVRSESGIGLSENPTLEQIVLMKDLVSEAMHAGCWGMTTGLEYQPGTFSNEGELAGVAQPVAAHNGVIMSHLRSEDDEVLAESIAELVRQGARSGARVHVSHIKSVYGKGAERAEAILSVLDAANEHGVYVTADIYPYTASFTTIGILFPQFALPPNDYDEVLKTQRAELAEYLHERVARRNGPEATLFGSGENAGKTLAQVSSEKEKPYADVLIETGPRGASAAYFVMDEELQARLLMDPRVNVCSDGSPSMRHPRGYGSFARVIKHYVHDNKLLTLEEAIHKMSGLPARTVGLIEQGRGLIQPGFAADILIFDPTKVKDTATFSEPFQLAEGFDTVLVNGTIIRRKGEFNGERAGRVLRKQLPPQEMEEQEE